MDEDGRDRLRIFDRLVQCRRRQAPSVVEKIRLIVGRIVSQPAGQRHYPAVVFNGEDISRPFLMWRLRVDDQRFPVKQCLVRAAIDASSVSNVDSDAGFLHSAVPDGCQPLRCLRTTSAGINNEVCSQFLLTLLFVAIAQVNPCDAAPTAGSQQSDNFTSIDEVNIGSGCQTISYVLFKEGSALRVSCDAAGEAGFP